MELQPDQAAACRGVVGIDGHHSVESEPDMIAIGYQPGLIGFEIESQPCKISVRNIWLRMFD